MLSSFRRLTDTSIIMLDVYQDEPICAKAPPSCLMRHVRCKDKGVRSYDDIFPLLNRIYPF